MEAAEIERRAECALRARAHAVDGFATHHVAARLAGDDAIAFDLRDCGAFGIAGGFRHGLDRLLATPALRVDAGVDDETRGAERGRLQIADAPKRIVFINAHLIGELFGIEPPAFDERAEEAERAAEEGQPLALLLDRDLPMMAGDAFVIGQSRQRIARCFGRIAQIDVVRAGARPIERRRLIIAPGRAGFDVGRHAHDLEWGVGHATKHFRHARAHRLHLAVEIGQQARAAWVGVRIKLIGAGVERLHARGDAALRHALAAQDRIHLRLQRIDQLHTHVVDFIRRHGGGCVGAQRGGVHFSALRAMHDARVMRRARADGAERFDLALIGRQHLIAHDGFRARQQRGALAFWNLRNFRQPAREGRNQHGLRRRGLREAAQLRHRAVDGEIRRDHAGACVLADHRRFLIQHARISRKTRQIRVGLVARGERVAAGQEIRLRGVGAAQLRDDVRRLRAGAKFKSRGVHGALHGGKHDVVSDNILSFETIAVDRSQRFDRAFGDGAVAAEALARGVAQAIDIAPARLFFADAQAGRPLGAFTQNIDGELIKQRVQLRPAASGAAAAGRRER